MRHTVITALFSVLILLCGTTGHRCYGQDSTLIDQDSLTYSRMKTPGEIRYAVEKDWTQDDWKDNEYYRCIRSTIDAYLESGLDQPGTAAEEFAPYRDILPGKFAICYAEHFMYGGLYISFVFVDEPGKIFTTWVYSYTDPKTETISGYEMRGLDVTDDSPFKNKKELRDIIRKSNAILF